MGALLEVDGGLEGQVDRPAQVDEVLFSEILYDVFLGLLLIDLVLVLLELLEL